MALENTVMLHDPVILVLQEGFQDRRRDIGVVEGAERVADVVEQRHHHIFLVAPVAMRTPRRLQAMRKPVDRQAAIIDSEQPPMHEDASADVRRKNLWTGSETRRDSVCESDTNAGVAVNIKKKTKK